MSQALLKLDHKRMLFLDGARGWASVMVLFYHTFVLLLGKRTAVFNSKLLAFPTDGALAVYIFFVISGFALAIPFRVSSLQHTLTVLALRRYIRLTIPILCSSLFAYLLMKGGIMFNQQAAPLANNNDWLGIYYKFEPSLLGWAKFSLFDVYFHYDLPSSYNHNLWTMSFELSGSFLIFATLSLVGKLRLRICIYLLMAVFLFFEGSFMLPFVLGLMLSEVNGYGWINRQKKGFPMLIASVILLCAAAFFSANYRQCYASPRFPSLVACSVVFAVMASVHVSRIFETPFSAFLGRISFPLYLTHLVVICSLSSYCYSRFYAKGYSEVKLNGLVALITIVASAGIACLFEPVERFAIHVSRWFSVIAGKEDSG